MNTRQLAPFPQNVDVKPVSTPYQHVSELVRHKLAITSGEEALTATNAAQESLGTAGILATLHMFAFYTPLDQGGLGLILGTTAGLAALGALSFTTLLITIPLSIAAYKNYKQKATKLIEAINTEENTRQKYQEELLYNIMVLRCLFAQNEAEFNRILNTLNLDNDEINAVKLQQQTSALYLNPTFHTALPPDEKLSATLTEKSLPDILSNTILNRDEDTQKAILSRLRTIDTEYQKNLDECFKEIAPLPTVNRGDAVMEGVNKALVFSSGIIATGITFAGICITAGFCIALSATGWGVLIAALVLGCVIFGVCSGMAEQKNLQREELQSQLKKRNTKLIDANHHVKAAITRQQLLISEQKTTQQALEQKSLTQKIALQDRAIGQLCQKVINTETQLAAEKQSHKQDVTELQRQLAAEKDARIKAENELNAFRERTAPERAQPVKLSTTTNIRFFHPPENPAGFSTQAVPALVMPARF